MTKRSADNPQVVQSIWHQASLYTRDEAASWCEEHDFKTNDYRARYEDDDDELITHHIHAQFDPSEAIEETWRFINDDFPEGVSASTCQRKDVKSMKIHYTKGIQSDDDPLDFVMSEESIDRLGDIIMADGWDLKDFKKNPIALWGHDHKSPIGVWENVRIVGKQLMGKLRFAAAGTSREIDTLRSLVEQRIIKAVSVGFRPVEYEEMKDATGHWVGYRFKKQALHETSLVSVPAHPNALAVAKSFGLSANELKTLLSINTITGQIFAPNTTRTKEGTAAKPDARIKPLSSTGTKGMKTIAQKIQEKRDRLVQIKDRLTEIKNVAEADDGDLSDEEQTEITTLTEENTSVENAIKGLENIELGLANQAKPVLGVGRVSGGAPTVVKEKGGSLLAKVATAKLIAHSKGMNPNEALNRLYGQDERVKAVAEYISKSAVDPATTTAVGWAAELVQTDIQGFLEALAPISVYAALRPLGVPLFFNGFTAITIPRRSTTVGANNNVAGSWVGEGGVIPVKRLTLASQTLNRYKAAVISAFTQEILEQSTPSIETIVRQSMLDDTAVALDAALLGNSNIVPGIRPAGLLYGVTLTPSAGSDAASIITDLKVLFAAMLSANVGSKPVLIMNSNRLLGLSTITTAAGGFLFRDEIANGNLLGVPVIHSTTVPASTVLIVDASSFASANDTPQFNISDQATLTMANADTTPPTQASSADGTAVGTAEQVPPGQGIYPGQPTNVPNAGYESLSLYQAYSTALRMILPTSWGLIRANAVAGLSGVNW